MKRKAFTMLELVLVIVVLGILAGLAMPRMERDLRQEAADNILSAIRYTQHMALIDNKHKFNRADWQRAFWQIQFENCSGGGIFYTIGTDDQNYQGDIDEDESILDPANGKRIFWRNTVSCANGGDSETSPNIFLSKKYGLTNISGTGGCDGVQYIGFDRLGRPQIGFSGSDKPDYNSYMSSDCNFAFSSSSGAFDPFNIIIKKETGYAYIDGQEDS